MNTGRALVGNYVVPEPDRDSGSKRIIDHVDLLRDLGYEVTFVTSQPLHDDRHLRALRGRGVGVYHGTPNQLDTLLTATRFDVALLAFWPTAELFVPAIRALSPQTRVIVDSVDLHFLRHARRIYGATSGGGLLDDRFGDQVSSELNVYAAADAVLTVSDKEAGLIDDLVNEAGLSRVVTDNEQLGLSSRGFDERHGLLFVGSFRHAPNVDAAAYLCREITPKLPAELLAEHPLVIVGDALDERVAVHGKGQPAVHMVGWVPTLEPYFEQARVCILPLLSGAGTKRKMIQALMLGTPVVGTSIAAEGLDLEDGRDVLIADDPASFVAAVERLTSDRELWERLRRSGRERALARHGREASREALRRTIEAVMAAPPKGPMLVPTDGELHHQRLLYQWQMSQLESGSRQAPTVAAAHDRAPARDVTPAAATDGDDTDVRLIAFYLPQFHPIPENDEWWGEGFTEWTNVRAAEPLFEGHSQPRAPGELGYYDLRDPGVRARQAALASSHGIDAFAYYHYWFDGVRLLEQPFSDVLHSGEPDLPFALCWANESWSRRWDGSEDHILQQQSYSREDDRAHIRALLPALADPRAVRVEGKPLFIVYQGHVLPEPAATTDIWREAADAAGLPGLHLLSVETGYDEGWDNTEFGFDGKIRFQPQFTVLQKAQRRWVDAHPNLHVYDYEGAVPVLEDPPEVAYPMLETVFPAWDNTARRGPDGWVLHGSTPAAYQRWLSDAIERARARPPSERIVFINAWNEWAEGAYLEPDEQHGRAYLEATRDARAAVAESA